MRRFSFIFLTAILLNGCGPRTTGPIVSKSTLEKRLTDIQSFIDSGNCGTVTQCQYIAYGKKACGGPAGYLVFSENIDVVKLKKMVNDYSIAEDIYNKENNVVSDCSLPTPPQKMQCEGGKCIEVK